MEGKIGVNGCIAEIESGILNHFFFLQMYQSYETSCAYSNVPMRGFCIWLTCRFLTGMFAPYSLNFTLLIAHCFACRLPTVLTFLCGYLSPLSHNPFLVPLSRLSRACFDLLNLGWLSSFRRDILSWCSRQISLLACLPLSLLYTFIDTPIISYYVLSPLQSIRIPPCLLVSRILPALPRHLELKY